MGRLLIAVALLLPGYQDTPTSTNPIDAYFTEYWRTEKVAAAAPADDGQFLRRLTLDMVGRLPTPAEVRSFLADKDLGKRDKLIDRLSSGEEFAEFMADHWTDIYVDYAMSNQDFARCAIGPFHRWLRQGFFEDRPYEKTVRALLSDRGGRLETPAFNFTLKHLGNQDGPPVKLAVMSAKLFSGRAIQCAQCHDHPFDNMTQQEFWGYVEYFRPLSRKQPPREDLHELQGQKARYLDGREGASLADLTLSDGEHMWSRTFINRMWKLYFGRGLIKAPREPGHEALLSSLVAHFEKNRSSVRTLVRTFAKSRAYQLTSVGKEDVRKHYAAGPVKAMSAIQYFRVFADIFNLHELHRKMYQKMEESPDAGEQFKDPEVMKIMFYAWARDLLLPSGRDADESAAVGTVRMAMKMLNNNRIQGMITAHSGKLPDGSMWTTPLAQIVSSKSKPSARVDELFLLLVNRLPDDEERAPLLKHIKEKANFLDESKPYEDVYWMLLNSAEFLFNH